MISSVNSAGKKIKYSDLRKDKNLAYFIGVLHSDGFIYVFNNKKRNRKDIRLILGVGIKSVPMAIKFQKILLEYFGRKSICAKDPIKMLILFKLL